MAYDMNYTNSLTSKGQVTIPKALRDKIGLKAGKPARISLLNDRSIVITTPLPAARVRELVGAPSNKQPLTAKEKQRMAARGLS